MNDEMFNAIETRLGLSRRAFMQFCAGVAATLGLSKGAEAQIAEAIATKKRAPVIWLHFSECTGCTMSMLTTEHPALDKLILEMISLDYHETLFAAAGHQAEEARLASMKKHKGEYILIVEGAIPIKDDGIYCKVGGHTAMHILEECIHDAAAVVALGSCAVWGGMPSSKPNPTGCVGVKDIWKDKPVVNIPGCAPNPYNLLTTLINYLTFGELPELDEKGAPKFAFSRLIHENCERRPHFDAGRFAEQFGDVGHRSGWCLYKLGCKGPETWANCPALLFGDVGSGSWPVGTGHPCIGCTEQGIGFEKPIHALANLMSVTSPNSFPRIVEEQGNGVTIGAAALVAGAAGVALGASIAMAKNLGKESQPEEPHGKD